MSSAAHCAIYAALENLILILYVPLPMTNKLVHFLNFGDFSVSKYIRAHTYMYTYARRKERKKK